MDIRDSFLSLGAWVYARKRAGMGKDSEGKLRFEPGLKK
jgi:hypothetical protein